SSTLLPQPCSTLFPYTTLFRSQQTRPPLFGERIAYVLGDFRGQPPRAGFAVGIGLEQGSGHLDDSSSVSPTTGRGTGGQRRRLCCDHPGRPVIHPSDMMTS